MKKGCSLTADGFRDTLVTCVATLALGPLGAAVGFAYECYARARTVIDIGRLLSCRTKREQAQYLLRSGAFGSSVQGLASDAAAELSSYW